MAILSILETRLKWFLYSENAPKKSNELRTDIFDQRWQAVSYCRLMKDSKAEVCTPEKCLWKIEYIWKENECLSYVIKMVAECKEMLSLNRQPDSLNFPLQNLLSLLRPTKYESTFLSGAWGSVVVKALRY